MPRLAASRMPKLIEFDLACCVSAAAVDELFFGFSFSVFSSVPPSPRSRR